MDWGHRRITTPLIILAKIQWERCIGLSVYFAREVFFLTKDYFDHAMEKPNDQTAISQITKRNPAK